jgi:hypothetical protein
MPSADRRTDAIGVAPNGLVHGGALETPADRVASAAKKSESGASAGSTTPSEATDRTRDGSSPAAPEDDDGDDREPFLPATPLPLAPLSAHIHARVRRFLDRPSRDARVRAVQKQARVSLRVIREAISRYGLRGAPRCDREASRLG